MNPSLVIVLIGLPVFLVLLWVGLRHKPQAGPANEAVSSQKAHGDAREATEGEAYAAAERGGARRSSVHDQEF